MSKEIDIKNAKCTKLSMEAPVMLAKKDSDAQFSIKAYTGAVVDRWWGKLAIEVKGISAKKQIPILFNHDRDLIVGYSTNTFSDDAFYVDGKFSDVTEKGREANGLAHEGFPWQASIGVRPIRILSIQENGSTNVNGQEVSGPAEIWLESEVYETSFVPLGADDNTSVARLSKFNEISAPQGETENQTEEFQMEFTIENLTSEAPELLATIQKAAREEGKAEGKQEGKTEGKQEGMEAERTRIQDVLAQSMPGHDALVQKLAFDGKTTGPEAAVQVLAAEKTIRINAKTSLTEDSIEPVAVIVPKDEAMEKKEITAENFNSHADLKEEFGSYDVYSAYKSAMDKGIVKITGGKK